MSSPTLMHALARSTSPALARSTSPARRLLTTAAPTPAPAAHRALVFRQPGALNEALAAHTFRALPAPGPGRVNLRVRLAPVNPSDVNVVEGVYPNKPKPEVLPAPSASATDAGAAEVCVPGNEGVAEVVEVGEGVGGLRVGDRVVFAKMQPGTWASARQVEEGDVIKVDRDVGDVTAATLSVRACGSQRGCVLRWLGARRSTRRRRCVCSESSCSSRRGTGSFRMVRGGPLNFSSVGC